MQHRGEIIRKAVYNSGYTITDIAKGIGKSRKWMYLMFENSNVSLDLILQIGEILHYNFSDEIKELHNSPFTIKEPHTSYGKEENNPEYWKNKYLELLENYTALLREREK